jgi:hypothetical protein
MGWEAWMRAMLTSVAVLGAVSVLAEPVDYKRGDEVRVQTAEGQPASPPVQRVIGVPADRIRLDASGAFINGQAIANVSSQLLLACGKWDDTVPLGHYFLMGEELTGTSATRSCALVPASRIVSAVQR